ncbi:MAG: hypothetical protein JRE23_07095 [Deltaproteobacteria bacterium]|nr:hypothetical protein [Deltaproteobacteria bacterium]
MRRTIHKLDAEGYYASKAEGRFAIMASALALDLGGLRIIKSVIGYISREELDLLLNFQGLPERVRCIIEVWFFKERGRGPEERRRLLYNRPSQRRGDLLRIHVK